MKKMLSMILLVGACAGTVVAADADVANVTAMAQKESGVTLDKLSLAVYEAVKAQPDKAVDIFRGVMSQRSGWSVTETYAVLRSVLLAAPGLEAGFVQEAASYQIETGTVDTLGGQLFTALYAMPQTYPVADAVVQGVLGSSVAARAAGNGISLQALETYVPTTPAASLVPEYPVTPTPPPTSANN